MTAITVPPFLCCWDQEKTQDLMNKLMEITFFEGEGCDEDWPDVLDILWQRTSGLGSLETFWGQIFVRRTWAIQRLIDFQSDKFLGTCRK